MESNDENNIDSTEESNSISTSNRNEKLSNIDRNIKKNSNVVYCSPTELEDWIIDEPKQKGKKVSKSKQQQQQNRSLPKAKIPKSAKPKSNKKRGRPKRKKDSNPWSDVDDENLGLENELSDDEYFRRLEEANSEVGHTNLESLDNDQNAGNDDVEDYEEDEEIYNIGEMKTFDLNNSDLLNYILSERENSLDVNDASKPVIEFPVSSNDLKCPLDSILHLFSIYETVIQYYKVLRLSPFKIEDFIHSMVSNENSYLLSEIHMSVLKLLIREDEFSNTSLCSLDQKDSVNLSFFLMDVMTWPELLRQYIKSIDSNSEKVHISEAYPFVSLYERIKILEFLLDLFVYGPSLRAEIARENSIIHEDFCRVCHTMGEVLCCDSCSAVYHLDCLTPQLTSVPKTTWNCPICVKHRVAGLYNSNLDGEKALVEHKKTPLGYDRFGNTYWFLARRLIIEPRNDNIDNLTGFILQKNQSNFKPEYDRVIYYSSWNAVEKLRHQLSRDWEAELCDVLDSLMEEIRSSMNVTKSLTIDGFAKFTRHLNNPSNLHVSSLLLDEILRYSENNDEPSHEFSEPNDNLSVKDDECLSNPVTEKAAELKTLNGLPVGVVEDQEGLLVRSIDGVTIRVRLSAKTRANQLEEVSDMFNFKCMDESDKIIYRLGDEGGWRLYKNLYTTEFEALSKFQHQEEKDRKRILGNKFSFNECVDFHWFVSQTNNRAIWTENKLNVDRPENDILGGPLNMLQCLRLTLQSMETKMFSSFMCPAWKSERKNWLINIQRVRNASSLAEFLLAFENAIRQCAFKKAWSNLIGCLYLERITAAEREEEKRVKTQERKSQKPDGELVKTRNPGLLRHTIWKTKGEEYRRMSGNGWGWICPMVKFSMYGQVCPRNMAKTIYSIKSSSPIIGSSDVIDISLGIDNDQIYKHTIAVPTTINSILNLRMKEHDKSMEEYNLELCQKNLIESTNRKHELVTKKQEMELRLDTLSKDHSKFLAWKGQPGNRKRPFPANSETSSVLSEKRMRFQNENVPYVSQYDGANDVDEDDDDDDDDDDEDEDDGDDSDVHQIKSENTPNITESTPFITATGTPLNDNNITVSNIANVKQPIFINNAGGNRLCVVNFGPTTNAGATSVGHQQQSRFMINARPQVISTPYTSQPQIIRLQNQQFIRLISPGNTQQQISKSGPGATAIVSPQIRKVHPSGQQILLLNNMPIVQGASAAVSNGNVIPICNVNNGLQVPFRFTSNQQQSVQQYKKLLPHDPSQNNSSNNNNINKPLQNSIIGINTAGLSTTATIAFPNNIVNTPRQNTPNQGRRSISKITHNNDARHQIITTTIDTTSDEMIQKKEIDMLCNEIVDYDQQLEQLDKHIAELQYQIGKINSDTAEPYRLFRQSPTVSAVDRDDEEYLLPVSNKFQWPEESDDGLHGLFLYNKEWLRALILASGRNELSGFDVEKKRPNNVYWSYPTARPGISTIWRYNVCQVLNKDYGNIDHYLNNLIATEPPSESGDKFNSFGSIGLSCLALNLKILWYSLRWDDMLMNWDNNVNNSSLQFPSVFKETLANGDILERKIIGWRPIDKFCTRCSYLLTICVSTSPDDLPETVTKQRTSRRGRRPVARYADTDNFTDDGERDSEDSDPNFIPGVNRTPKPRGRRSKYRQAEEAAEVKHCEKKYSEEWAGEDDLGLWEIRDFLISVQWKRAYVCQPKNHSSLVTSILNKRVFQKNENPFALRQQTIFQPVQISGNLVPNIEIQQKPIVPIIEPAKTETFSNINIASTNANNSVPSSVEKPQIPIEVPVISVMQNVILPVEINIPKPDIKPKLIIESPVKKVPDEIGKTELDQTVVGAPNNNLSVGLPVPLTDIREVSRSETQSTPRGRGRIRGRGRGGRGRNSSRRSESSCSEENKYEDLSFDLDGSVSLIVNRMMTMKQNTVDIETIRALNKLDDVKFSELAKKESKKIKKGKKDNYKDGGTSDELTEREVETGSTSPAVDGNPEDRFVNTAETDSSTQNYNTYSRKGKNKRSYKESCNSDEETYQESVTPVETPIKNRKTVHKKIEHATASKSTKAKAQKHPQKQHHHHHQQQAESDEENAVYCICKTPYNPSQNYIGCDVCLNWFHFSCVGMTEKKASQIKSWKCSNCNASKSPASSVKNEEDPNQIYCSCRKKYDPTKLYIACDFCDEWYHPQCVGLTDAQATQMEDTYKCPSCSKGKDKKKVKKEPSSSVTCHKFDYERKIDSDIHRKLADLLNRMMKQKDALSFLHPVDSKKSPGYYQVVKTPMDLTTVRQRLDNQKYPNLGSFKLDIHKIFTACRQYYDKTSREYQSADSLENYFQSELRGIC